MMLRKNLSILVGSLLLINIFTVNLFTTNAASAETVRILSCEEPPANFTKDGVFTGITTEFIQAIQKSLGNKSKIEVYPFARSYDQALKEPNVILYTIGRNKDREDKFYWISQVTRRDYALYAKKEFSDKITSYGDLKKYTIGTINGNIHDKILRENGLTKIEGVTTHDQDIKKLVEGRIDLMATSSVEFAKVCKDNKMNLANFKNAYIFFTADSYIGMSKATKPEIAEKWMKAAEKLKNDGTYEKIANKWIKYLKDEYDAECMYKNKVIYFYTE